eukprot:11159821-Lingulodinium_polyedra.AAC.1
MQHTTTNTAWRQLAMLLPSHSNEVCRAPLTQLNNRNQWATRKDTCDQHAQEHNWALDLTN